MAETSRKPDSKMSAMESVTEDPSQPLSPLKKGKNDTTQAIEHIRLRAKNLGQTFWILQWRGFIKIKQKSQKSPQLKEQKDFITHKLELDEERLLVISEQKGHTSGSALRVLGQVLWSENRLVVWKRELLREETLLSKLEEKALTSLEGRSKSDDNSSHSEILNALTELMQVQEDWSDFHRWHWIYDSPDYASHVCYEILVYAETFLFLLESQVHKGKQAIKSTDQHSRVDSLRRVVDAQQELLNMQKMTYQKMTGTTQEKKTPGQGESEEGKKKLLQRMSVTKQEEGTVGQAETAEGIKQTADTSKQLELILKQTRVTDEIKREGLYRTSTDQELFSVISATFETTFDAMLLLTNSSTLMPEHLIEIFKELLCQFEQMPVAIHDSRYIYQWMENVNSTLIHTMHSLVREIRKTSEPLQKLSVKESPSQDQEMEIRSRAKNLRETFKRLRGRGFFKISQQSLQLEEQKDFITHKLELDKKRLLVISEQKGHTSGSVLKVLRQALWSENRLVALKRELLREETLLSKLKEKALTSLESRSKSDDNSLRSEILNALTELMQVQEQWYDFYRWHWICDFPDYPSHVCYEILVYSETFLLLLESQVHKGKQAIKSTDQQSRVDSLRQVVDAQQELLNMQKMTYQKMIGTTQEKKTLGQGESEEGKKKLLQRMSVTKQEEGTVGQAETAEGIKQTADTSKKLELILKQTRVTDEIEREGLYHTSTDQELFSLISATFETTFDAILLLKNSSTLTLEHFMEIFEELLRQFEQKQMAIPDSRQIYRWAENVNRMLMHALHPTVREIRETGEPLQKLSVKEPPSQDQEMETSVSRRTPSDDSGKSEAGPVEHVPRLQEERLHMDRALQILNEDEAVQKLPNRLPTHLQKVLKELETNIAQIRDGESSGHVYQLPYISMGYFDSEGGRLSLKEYNVNLFVPRGAIPDGQVQQVYVYVDPDAPPMNDIDPPATALSRMIQCGPSGLTFQKKVILSFPYHADKDIKWTLSVQECNNDNDVTKTWRNLDDGVLFTEDEVIVQLEHFTGERVIGIPTPDVMCAGVFGSKFDPNLDLYVIHVHVWKNEQSIQQGVFHAEQSMDYHLLDVCQFFRFQDGGGDIRIDVIKTSLEWRVTSAHLKSIPEADVRCLPENSVTFDLRNTLQNENPAFPDIPFLVALQQAPNGAEKVFQFRSLYWQVEVKQGCTCGSTGALVLCPSCRETLRSGLDQFMNETGNYGGMSATTLGRLCEVLDKESRWNLIALTACILNGHGINWHESQFESLGFQFALDLIAFHFSRCHAKGLPQDAGVVILREYLNSLNIQKAVNILEEGMPPMEL